MADSLLNQDEAVSFLKVWLTRILVTAAIATVLEFVIPRIQGAPPAVPPQDSAREEEEVMTMQYSELGGGTLDTEQEKENSASDDKAEEDKPDTDTEAEDTRHINDTNANADTNTAADTTEDDEEDIYADEEGDDTDDKENQDIKDKENNDEKDETSDANATATAAERTPNSVEPAAAAAPKPPKFRNKSIYHPGMEGYHRWYDIETSLFRQYNVGRTDGVDVIPPYVPKSRNGQVKVALRVTNHYAVKINVYWINYQGHEDFKGSITRGETWYQTTYVEHPWVFRLADTDEPEEPLLVHYIPERVIPHLDEVPTIEDEHPMVGVQRFSITGPTDQAIRDHYICSIHDAVMPHPAKHHFHNPNQAHTWTLLQMKRMSYFDYNPGATLLTKYITNIAMQPDNPNYRHIRIANKKFTQSIWQTAARGLLLATGFVEQQAFAELGTAKTLSAGLVQDVSLVLHRLEQCLNELASEAQSAAVPRDQPDGADGSGRAGFRRR